MINWKKRSEPTVMCAPEYYLATTNLGGFVLNNHSYNVTSVSTRSQCEESNCSKTALWDVHADGQSGVLLCQEHKDWLRNHVLYHRPHVDWPRVTIAERRQYRTATREWKRQKNAD